MGPECLRWQLLLGTHYQPDRLSDLGQEVNVMMLSQCSQLFERLILNFSCMLARPNLNVDRNEMLPLVSIFGIHTLIISRDWDRASLSCLWWQSCFMKFCPSHQLQSHVFFPHDGTTAWHCVRVVGNMGHFSIALWMFEHEGSSAQKAFKVEGGNYVKVWEHIWSSGGKVAVCWFEYVSAYLGVLRKLIRSSMSRALCYNPGKLNGHPCCPKRLMWQKSH